MKEYWSIPRMWKDGECFIIGGGPSLLKQFNIPEKVISDVLSKKADPSVYSPYLSALHSKHVIGINAAFKIGSWIEVVFFGDAGFLLNNIYRLSKFPGLKVTTNAAGRKYTWIKNVKQARTPKYGITTNRRELVWGLNSGACAINLAIQFGVKRIILLGFDLSMSSRENLHWHREYKIRSEKSIENSFSRHSKSFPPIAEDTRKLGIEILNANPESRITCFKKIQLQEVLL